MQFKINRCASLIWIFLVLIYFSCQKSNPSFPMEKEYVLVIHGGAGVITRNSMDSLTEKSYREAMDSVLTIGEKILASGGKSLDAVEAVVSWMEDNPLFNAGKGAVFTYDGKNEMDASIMNGVDLSAGAVSGVRHIRNPIKLARMVMEKSPHVMLFGEGAEEFAKLNGVELVDTSYFFTQKRWDAHL